MITINLLKDCEGLRLTVSGHALLGKKGQDTLCAGVSAMVQMLELGITQVLGIKKEIARKNDSFFFPSYTDKTAQIMIKSFFLSCLQLEKQYPNHIKTKTVE